MDSRSVRGVVSHAVVKRTPIPVFLLLLMAVAVLLPIAASAYVSTGPSSDRSWFWQNPLPQGNDLRSASWINASTGWAVGVTGTALKTTDGGVTWAAFDAGTQRDLTGVAFVDANNGWIAGLAGTIQHTTDGGATWTAQTAPTVPAARNLRAISFFNASVGVAVGDQGTTTSTIVYTSNGGATWRAASTTSTVGLSSVQMVSATTGWAVGGSGAVLKTTNGGATWVPVASPTSAGLSAISFAPGGVVGYFVGNAALPNWTIYKTTNSGTTWTAVNGLGTTGAVNLTGVSCLDANNAITVGTNGQIRHTTNGGTTWLNQSQNNLGSNSLRDVRLIDANNIKAIGDFGVCFYTRNSGAFWFTSMLGNNATYLGSMFVDANNGWAVGTNGTIMRTANAGQSWETQASGITSWRGVSFTSLTSGWVVGDGGQILHTVDGVNWTAQTSGVTQQLNSVWFMSATNGVAVGANGTILRTTNGGSSWSVRSSGTTQQLNAVWFADATRGWAVGANGVILRSTNGGSSWTAQTSGTTQTLLTVRGASTTAVWAAGNNGTVVRTTNGGTNWTAQTSGAGTNPIRTIFFTSATNGWFASTYGIVRRTTDAGVTWTSQNAGLPTSTSDPSVGIYSAWFASGTTGYLFGDVGTIKRTVDAGSHWASLQYGTLSILNDVRFADATNGWMPGNGGAMMNTADGGQTWTMQKTGTNNALNGVSVLSSQTVWAAGDNGTIRRTNDGGLTWAGQTSGVLVNLDCISAVDSNHAVVCGVGTIKYTANGGSSWTTGTVDTTQTISSVHMVDVNNGWAVGGRLAGNNVVYHTTDGGATWSAQATTANANLWVVYFRDANTGYAGGDSGVILKTTNGGGTWIRQTTPTTLPFYAIQFSDANNGIATGGGGVLARTSDGGTTWTLQASGTARALTGVAYTVPSRAWISGGQGAILRNADLTPPVTTLTKDPSGATGANGWYNTQPSVSLLSNKPGVTYYGWTSSAGPFATYAGSFLATEGATTLYYYSVDASSNAEAVKSTPFNIDLTPPEPATLVTATSVATSTAQIDWMDATDAVSGVNRYDVYVNNTYTVSTLTTTAVLSGLSPATLYSVTVNAVDTAGNISATSSPPALFSTTGMVTTPLTTIVSADPIVPDGANDWYVTTPTVTLATLPMGVPSTIKFSWTSAAGPYGDYIATITPPGGAPTLYFAAYDPDGIRTPEATRQATFNVDTAVPAAPSVTASATSYASVNLTWPAVVPTPSGIARYDIYEDGSFLTSTTDPFIEVVGLTASTSYNFAVYAINSAGTTSTATPVSATTPMAPLPAAPDIVFAKSPSGFFSMVNWTYSRDALGTVHYRIWRSTDGVNFAPLATTVGGIYDTQYIDSTLSASRQYWYAISTVDVRGESSLSDTSSAVWPSIATTTTGPQRPSGLAAVEASGQVLLSWTPSANPTTVGYKVLRADASLATPTVLTSLAIADTFYFDTDVTNGQPYFYSVVAVDASGTVGSPSTELSARPHFVFGDESPHILDGDNSTCICHATHTATSSSSLIRFPGATKTTVCDSCHAPASSLGEFLDPLAKSRHSLGATSSPEEQFTCNTCHRPVKQSNEATANLMRTNSDSPCVVVTDTPAGNAFCYKCHGAGSTLPQGDLTGFEQSAHATIAAPPTGAGITCDACHESHSSRNEHLNRYSGFMMCVKCHNSEQIDPNALDIWTRLTQNSESNAKHPLLPQDQVSGARMTCQNCHNTHSSSAKYPLVDPHDPSPRGEWTTPQADEKAFCFTCHNGQALPTSQETTPWAEPVLASGAATSVANIKDAYQVNVHGFGQRSGSTTTTAYLRPDMGYQYGDVLECRSCHDPHGTTNNYALQQTVRSATGLKSINGVTVAPVAGGGYDLRFFCNTCHLFDSATHDSIAGTSTVTFPTNCTACHRHIRANGTPSSNL
jgi:predicted CXXCH cytochrome family protein